MSDKKLSEEDELLLQSYNMGWDDCCENKEFNSSLFPTDSLLEKAYSCGWSDFIAGDDVSSVDLQTEEEILEKIKSIQWD